MSSLLSLSEEYEIPKIKQRCEQFFMTQSNPTLPTLALAERYQLRQVYNKYLDQTRTMSLQEIEKGFNKVSIEPGTETEIYRSKVRALQDENTQLRRDLSLMSKKCSSFELDKISMQEAMSETQKMWDNKSKRCYKHVNDIVYDYTCFECNEKLRREIRHTCSSGLLRVSAQLMRKAKDRNSVEICKVCRCPKVTQ